MKVLFVITKSEAGGAQTHVYQLARALRERGDEPLIMAHPGGWLERAAADLGVDFCRNPHLSNRIDPIADIRASRCLSRIVRRFQPDLVSAHSSKAGIVTRLTVRGRVPTLFTAHGWGFAERGSIASRLVFIPAEKLAARYTRKIVCVSAYVRDVALRYRIATAEKMVVIHNGAEPNDAKGDRGHRDSDAVTIVFVGRLVGQKDPETLLSAYASLPEAVRRKTRLRIIGEGEKRPTLQAIIRARGLEDRVELPGFMERDAVLGALKGADIFVLTTHYEGLPRTAVEAMHAGLPVIASDVWGVRELFESQPADNGAPIGVLVAERQVDEVAAAIERLVCDTQLRIEMGRTAAARATESFSLDAMVQRTFHAYEQALR